jgi:hypothetical protein
MKLPLNGKHNSFLSSEPHADEVIEEQTAATAGLGQFLPPRFAPAMEDLAQKPDAKAPTALPLYD